MTRPVCLHHLEEIDQALIPGFAIAARTTTRQELRQAVGTLNISAVVLDLDEPGAVENIVNALEIKPRLGIVGVTGKVELGPVLVAQRAGCSVITTRPIDPADLLAALRQAVGKDDEPATDGQTLAILGSIGGAGSTTLACNLAAGLAQITGSPTALFDLDLEFGGVAAAFDLDTSFTIADLARAGAVDRSLLEKAALKLPLGLHVFDRPRTIRDAHGIDQLMVRTVLGMARKVYRNVLIDLPRRLDDIVGCALEQTNRLILVVQLTVPSIKNARRIVEALEAEGVARDRIEIVVNRYNKAVHSCTVEMVQDQLRKKVLGLVPSDFESVHRALDVGAPLSKRNSVRNAIREIAVRLAGVEQEEPRTKGWLSRISLGG
jgi:pilus assembly protein CpaE